VTLLASVTLVLVIGEARGLLTDGVGETKIRGSGKVVAKGLLKSKVEDDLLGVLVRKSSTSDSMMRSSSVANASLSISAPTKCFSESALLSVLEAEERLLIYEIGEVQIRGSREVLTIEEIVLGMLSLAAKESESESNSGSRVFWCFSV
jgi:hypothetical protein